MTIPNESTDLMSLPHGTTFHVVNGNWEGEIIDRKDGKYIKNAIHEFKITENYRHTLYLDNVTMP